MKFCKKFLHYQVPEEIIDVGWCDILIDVTKQEKMTAHILTWSYLTIKLLK